MKKILITSLLLIGLSALAVLPQYTTKSGYGNASAGAKVYFPANPTAQIRVTYVNYASDSNTAVLSFTSGTTAFAQTATNVATSSVTNQISGTNGLSVGATLYLERAGVGYTSTVVTWNQTTNAGPYGGTNVVLASGGWGVAAHVGDNIYLMSSAVALPAGATTNVLTGDAIYVGEYGRPVSLSLTPALVTNRLYSVSAKYDQ